MKIAAPEALAAADADESFKTADTNGKDFAGRKFTIQISTGDCVGCTLCSVVCPARKKDADGNKTEESALKMVPNTEEVPEAAAKNWKIFMALPEVETALADPATVKGSLKGSSKNWCFWQLLLRNRLIIR